ncbi:hypothetical protein B0J14DRAFT_704103 [Halenospora varia]|nr:hypothetical protein B0J14DRAFT_704103 [Halenospora varia]
MHFTSILSLAAMAIAGVAASPSFLPQNTCPSNQRWDPWGSQCKCRPNKEWDDNLNKCCYPKMLKPPCPPNEKVYCAKSQEEWCEYDEHNEYCKDSGHNVIFHCQEKDRDYELKKRCLSKNNKPQCPGGQEWSADDQKCTCSNGMIWKDNICKHPPHKKEKKQCKQNEKLYCFRTKNDYCEYDENRDECQDDGETEVYCCEPNQVHDFLQSRFHWV